MKLNLCNDPEPHEPHNWSRAIGPGVRGVESVRCPGIEDLPVASCPDDEPHESHDWRADSKEDLKHCPGVEEDADPHELEFIWDAGRPHPVQIICRCGDRFRVVGP